MSVIPGRISPRRIRDLEIDDLTAGTILSQKIYIGSTSFELDGGNVYLLIKDTQGTPVTRVKLGKTGVGAGDYGLQIWGSNGSLLWDLTGVTPAGILPQSVDLATKVIGLLPNANLQTISDATKIADALLTQSKVASGFKLWALGTSLPAFGNQGTMFYRTTDNTLWEDTGSAWKEIVRSGFAAYDHILALTITGGLIVAGTIAGDKIAVNTLNGNHIVANTLNGNHMQLNSLLVTGTAQIADSIIVGNNVVANTLNGNHIVANTLNGNHMQLNSLLVTGTAQIADLIVGTTKVINNAITNSGAFADDAVVTIGSTETEAGSITITTDGGYNLVIGVGVAISPSYWNFWGSAHIRKDSLSGTLLDNKRCFFPINISNFQLNFACMGIDTAPASTQTYKLTGLTPGGVDMQFFFRRLIVMNLKK